MELKIALLNSVDFSESELKKILDFFDFSTLKKGQLIITEGKICNKLYFIKKGIVKSYYQNENGKEITQWFFNEGKFMTSIESFYQQTPSLYSLEVIEDAEIFSISRKKLDILFDEFSKMERFGRLLAVEMLIKVANKLNALQFQKAKERYDYMIHEFPNIYYRVPLGDIASYLGMSQETLSRIRKN